MVLTIKAVNYKGQPLISPLVAEFDEKGGTLGRASGNHLVLADDEKVVSGEHGILSYENGSYYYTDTSLNGTQITNRNQRIHQKKILLEDRDELRVGDYDLIVTITSNPSERLSRRSQSVDEAMSLSMFDQFDQFDQGDGERRESPSVDNRVSDDVSLSFEKDLDPEYPGEITAINDEYHSPISESFIPPGLKAQSGQTSELPDNLSLDDFFSNERQTKESISDAGFDSIAAPAEDRVQSIPEKSAQNQADLRGSDASSGAANQPLARKAPPYHSPQTPGPMKEKNDAVLAKDAAELFHIFLKAAGIEDPNGIPKDKIPELMRTVGTVFRELIDGLMAVLRGRTELKSHLRVSMTTLKPTDNNPLKFSPTVEEALKTFLVNSHPGFIDAVDAVHEGYEDIKNHQLAITAGVQASLVSILNRFEPQHFSEKLKEGVVLQKKAKCWDAYRQAYQQIVEEAMEDFFGDDFVRAYEKQIDRLRTNRK